MKIGKHARLRRQGFQLRKNKKKSRKERVAEAVRRAKEAKAAMFAALLLSPAPFIIYGHDFCGLATTVSAHPGGERTKNW